MVRLRVRGYREYREQISDRTPGLSRLIRMHVTLESSEALPVRIEVHWTLGGSEGDHHAPDMAWFCDQVEPLDLRVPVGSTIRVPSGLSSALLTLTATARLLYLAGHLMLQHGEAETRLLSLYDIHPLIEREGGRIEWDELAQSAHQFRWSAAVVATLRSALDCFGTRLPKGSLGLLATDEDRRAADLVRRKAAPLQTRATDV